jgi:hypothetical protein
MAWNRYNCHYNRRGELISLEEWARLFEDLAYKRVFQCALPDGKWISTVWIGLDHNWDPNNSRILIFETMVFESREGMEDLEQDRYETELEAMLGHAATVQKWQQVAELNQLMRHGVN